MADFIKSVASGASTFFGSLVSRPTQEPTVDDRVQDVVERTTTVEAQLDTETGSRVYTPQEHGVQETGASFGSSVTSFINSRAVLRGATIPWNKERLIEGKLKQYEQIGGEPLTITTKTGDRISAFHFDVKNFHQEVARMGGQMTNLEVQVNHPFFESAQAVKLKSSAKSFDADAVRIPYSAELESEFKNPKDFLEFCQKMGYELFWEDSMQPFETASWWHFNSMKQNLILVPKFDVRSLDIATNPSSITVENSTEFGPSFAFLRNEPLKSAAIVFEDNIDEVERLFSGASIEGRGLKIENSSWNMIRYDGKLYFIANPAVESALGLAENKGLGQLSSFQVASKPVLQPKLDAERATVVLSMNQTNSFASYSHEVLTFLFSGVNVLAYDNAGKGLSEGQNSQEGMTEAIRSAGRYLIKEKGLRQNQIIFKGQCAGGLPSSEAATMFPASHVWVDQAPQTFSGAAKGIVLKKAEQAADSNESSWLKTFSGVIPYVAPIVKGATSLVLPSYDVVDNLKRNHGIQIYTIGVPDERGYGGDEMVPTFERDEIEKAVRLNPKGHYLTITGGTHVTDWWTDQDVAHSVDTIFKRFSFSADVFPESPKTATAAVKQSYQDFYQKAYDASTATEDEQSVYEIFEAVKDQDLDAIKHIMNWRDAIDPFHPLGLSDQLSYVDRQRLIRDAISLSRDLGNESFTQKLMMAQRNNVI